MDQAPRIRVELPALDPASGEERPGVALVIIDRPAVLNAIDHATAVAHPHNLRRRPDLRVNS